MEIKVDLFHGNCDMTISECSSDGDGKKQIKLRMLKTKAYVDEIEHKISETENVMVITLDGVKELYYALGAFINNAKYKYRPRKVKLEDLGRD